MAVTIKDPVRPSVSEAGRPPVQRNVASLVGGFVIAFGCFVLFLLVASELAAAAPTLPVIAAGAAFAIAIGIWIRLADL